MPTRGLAPTVVPHARKYHKNMIQRLIVYGLVIILTYSCETKTVAKFEIKNQTNNKIDSLRIVPNGYESDYFVSLNPGETKKYDCDMTEIAKVDGEYKLDYKSNTSYFVSKTFGYYTNGYPIESLIKLSIEADSLIIDSEINKY